LQKKKKNKNHESHFKAKETKVKRTRIIYVYREQLLRITTGLFKSQEALSKTNSKQIYEGVVGARYATGGVALQGEGKREREKKRNEGQHKTENREI
jgi:hypothetical protein